MKKLFFILFPALLLSSCGKKQEEAKNESAAVNVAVIKVKPETIKAEGKKVEASKFKVNTAGKPVIDPTNINVVVAGTPQYYALPDDLKGVTPGTDTFSMPKAVPANGKQQKFSQLNPVIASAPRYKDASICNIKYLDVDQGLISSTIKAIIRDRNGNIWFGSTGSGVCRYDGRSFLYFNEKNGLSSNSILSLLEDKNGNIWIGTDGGGVCVYNGTSLIRYSKAEGLSDNTVLSIVEDKKGNIWLSTNAGGVNCFDGKSFTQYTEKEGLLSNDIRSMAEDNNGNMWFGTNGRGVCKWDGKRFSAITEEDGLANNTVLAMVPDKKGNIWMATDAGGVSLYEKFPSGKMGFTNYSEKEGLANNSVTAAFEDANGNMWFGTYGGGLSCFDGKNFIQYTEKQGLSNNYVFAINADNSGNLWFGTYGGGACLFDTKSFSHYTEKEGFSNNTVRSITEDKNGNIWFGIFGDGVAKYDGTSFTHYSEAQGLSNKVVKCIYEDASGDLWFATDGGGVDRFDGKGFTVITTEEGFISDYVVSITQDKKGNMWFGSDEGVCKYDGESFTYLTEDEGLCYNDVACVYEDRAGNLWIGTNGGGVDRYDGEKLTHYSEKAGLPNGTVKSIFEDKAGNIWMGTEGGGVCKLNPATNDMSIFTEKEGLSSNIVHSIKEDKQGNFWMGTNKGLNYFIPSKDGGAPQVYVYNSSNGLKANDFYANSALIDSKNRAWWGSGKALSTLDLNNFKISSEAPKMELNNLELEQTFIDFYTLKDSLNSGHIEVGDNHKSADDVDFSRIQPFFNYPVDLSLPHHLNHLTFHFSAIDWASPEKIKYQYMIEGLDEEWSPLSTENKAVFNNLPHGNFTFKVKAIGVANKWSDTFEYNFTIETPWYKTPVAYVIYVLGFIGIVIGFNNVRTRQLKIRQEELEQTVKERTHEVVQQKELIEEKQKEIVDSINYARRIQYTLLAHDEFLKANLGDHFVLFQPKDIVSGDFYWATKKGKRFYLAVCDSTGHGVPGAFMSLLNISFLNEAITEKSISEPHEILNYVRERLETSISVGGAKDGMDGILLCVEGNKVTYAAANNSPVIVSEGVMTHLEADKMPIGKGERNAPFRLQTIDVKKGDYLYLYTDGYADQFGGPKGKKFKYKQLDDILLDNYKTRPEQQKEILSRRFNDWKGSLDQVDDVLLIGIHF